MHGYNRNCPRQTLSLERKVLLDIMANASAVQPVEENSLQMGVCQLMVGTNNLLSQHRVHGKLVSILALQPALWIKNNEPMLMV